MNWIQYLLDQQELERQRRLQMRMNKYVPKRPQDDMLMKGQVYSPLDYISMMYPELLKTWTMPSNRNPNKYYYREHLIDEV